MQLLKALNMKEKNNMLKIEDFYVIKDSDFDKFFWQEIKEEKKNDLSIVDVIFNDPATIVKWSDGTKTIVKAQNEKFDKEKGLAMAIVKKITGNKSNFNEIFKAWCVDDERNDV